MKCNRSANTRLISALILLSLLTGLESCGGSTDGDVTTEPDSGTTVPTETTTDIYAGLPSGNYNGAEFNILNNSFTYAEYRLDAEAINGDTFSDAVYERTRKVEDMLDVKINVTNMDYWSENAVSHINNIVMSGDDSIDACFLGVMNNISAISNGIYVDLNEID